MKPSEGIFFTSSELTATPGLELRSTFPKYGDFLVRVITGPDDTTSARSYVLNTSDFQARLYDWASGVSQDIDQLRSVVHWQHRVIDYNSVYQAFLMDQLTDDEFEAAAEKYAYEPTAINPEDLATKVQRVYQLTGIPYTPSDVSDLFQCNHDEARQAIAIIQAYHPELGNMLSEDDQ